MARKLLDPCQGIDPSCKQKCDKPIEPDANCPPCKRCPLEPCNSSPIAIPCLVPPLPPPPPPPPHILNPPPNRHHQILPIYLTVPLGILAATFLLFTCYTVYKFYSYWYKSRRRMPRGGDQEEDSVADEFLDEDHGPIVDHPIWYIRTVGLQPSVISAITVVKYKRGEGLVEGTDCSVCLTEFQEDETLRLLPKCNHAFHLPCIDTWLRSHTNCPMCRAGIVIAISPPLENSENSGMVEEALTGDVGSNREVNRGIENEDSELRIGIEESRDEIGEKVNEIGLDVVQPVRRSVSFDSLSASIISAAVVNAFPGQSGKQKEAIAKNDVINQSSSIMQTGSSSVKRSASCSAKVFLLRHSGRSRN